MLLLFLRDEDEGREGADFFAMLWPKPDSKSRDDGGGGEVNAERDDDWELGWEVLKGVGLLLLDLELLENECLDD